MFTYPVPEYPAVAEATTAPLLNEAFSASRMEPSVVMGFEVRKVMLNDFIKFPATSLTVLSGMVRV